jgi:hypothetical protein
MAKRKPRTHICSNCFDECLEKEMYVVEKFVNQLNNNHGYYDTVYCKKCTKKATNYVNIISKPTE